MQFDLNNLIKFITEISKIGPNDYDPNTKQSIAKMLLGLIEKSSSFLFFCCKIKAVDFLLSL